MSGQFALLDGLLHARSPREACEAVARFAASRADRHLQYLPVLTAEAGTNIYAKVGLIKTNTIRYCSLSRSLEYTPSLKRRAKHPPNISLQ